MSLEDVLAARSALEMYESHIHDNPLESVKEEDPVIEEDTKMEEVKQQEGKSKRKEEYMMSICKPSGYSRSL